MIDHSLSPTDDVAVHPTLGRAPTAGPRRLALRDEFEARMASIVQAIFGRRTTSRIVERSRSGEFERLGFAKLKAGGVSPEARDWIVGALGRGMVEFFARRGIDEETFLGPGGLDARPVTGSLWERHGPEKLRFDFSPASLEFLIWLAATWRRADSTPRNTGDGDVHPRQSATAADELLTLIAYRALRGDAPCPAFRSSPLVRRNFLVRLFFPTDFPIESESDSTSDLPNPTPWLSEDRVWALETLQSDLAEAWRSTDAAVRAANSIEAFHGMTAARDATLDAFLDAIERAERRDLARFLLDMAVRMSESRADWRGVPWWRRDLRFEEPRMADRPELVRLLLGPLDRLTRLAQWRSRALATDRFDEGYQAARHWLSVWNSRAGDDLIAFVDRIRAEADPLNRSNRVSDDDPDPRLAASRGGAP